MTWSCEGVGVVMARSTAIHKSTEVPATRKIERTNESLFTRFSQIEEQNWCVPSTSHFTDILWLISS